MEMSSAMILSAKIVGRLQPKALPHKAKTSNVILQGLTEMKQLLRFIFLARFVS